MDNHYKQQFYHQLNRKFTKEQLCILCYDSPEFHPVYQKLTGNARKEELISLIIDHSSQKSLFPQLLDLFHLDDLVKHQSPLPITHNQKAQNVIIGKSGDGDGNINFSNSGLILNVITQIQLPEEVKIFFIKHGVFIVLVVIMEAFLTVLFVQLKDFYLIGTQWFFLTAILLLGVAISWYAIYKSS